MQHFTFYSHYLGIESLADILKETYPEIALEIEQEQSQLNASTPSINLNYRQRSSPSYQMTEEQSPLMKNLKGLYGYISQIPMTNNSLQEKLLFKITTINSEFTLMIEEGDEQKLRTLIAEIAEAYDAVIFVNGENALNEEEGPHFLNQELKLISNFAGKSTVEDLIVNVESKYFDQKEHLPEALERKERTEQMIVSMGVSVNHNLPPILASSETNLRAPKEIAERLVALAICNFVAFDHLSGGQALNYLEGYHLLHLLSPQERTFLEKPTRQRKMQETWKSEAIWVLLWALGKVDDLGSPASLCDLNAVAEADYPVGPNKDPNTFIQAVKSSRSFAEVLDTNDLYYRLHWAVVDARLQEKEIAQLHGGVVYERHYALNWLINYRNQDWDEVSCDT
jgi:hypothetical protein